MQVFEENVEEGKAGTAGGDCDREESGKRCEGIWMRDGLSGMEFGRFLQYPTRGGGVRDSEAIRGPMTVNTRTKPENQKPHLRSERIPVLRDPERHKIQARAADTH
jgi:hypothetical protein